MSLEGDLAREKGLAKTLCNAIAALDSAIADMTCLRKENTSLSEKNRHLREVVENFRDNWKCASIFGPGSEDICSCPHCLSVRTLSETNAPHKKSTTPAR